MMNNKMELNLDELRNVSGGENLREDPMYNAIMEAYKTKGTRTASALCYRYFGNDKGVEMMKLIQADADRMAENYF